MPHPSHPQPDPWEPDDVWDALGAAKTLPASPRFVDQVMRAVKLDGETPAPWWKHWFLPASLGGLAAATATVMFAFSTLVPSSLHPADEMILSDVQENFEDIQDFTDAEILVAAADYLDYYSDSELVSLISL